MNKPEILAVISDLHVGSKVGLHAPTAGVTDRYQRRLWNLYLEFTEKFRSVVQEFQGIPIVVFNGDLIDLDLKDRSHAYHYSNPVDAHAACIEAISPLAESAEHLFFLRGTPSHTGKSAQYEEAIARDWDHTVWWEDDKASWWHLRASFGGVRFDIKHHFSMGRLPHTEKNAANKLAYLVQWNAWDLGEKVPHVAIRSHNHRTADSGRNYKVQAIITGAWQLRTEYAHRGEWAEADIGAEIFVCQNGEYQWLPQRYTIPTVTAKRPWPTLKTLTK